MTHRLTPQSLDEKLVVRGIQLNLTGALKFLIRRKVAKLIRREPRIVRVRIDVAHDRTQGAENQFVTRGHIEIGGADLSAQTSADHLYKSIDDVVAKLDRALRKRATEPNGPRDQPRDAEIGFELSQTT